MSKPFAYNTLGYVSQSPSVYQTPVKNLNSSYVQNSSTIINNDRVMSTSQPVRVQSQLNYLPTNLKSELDKDLKDIEARYQTEAFEVQKSYQTNYEKHLKLGKTVQDLTALLDEERRKVFVTEERLGSAVRDLDNERRCRIDLEHECNGLRDELKRKEAVIAEVDNRRALLEQDVTHVTSENSSLRGEINRISELFNVKLRETEDRYIGQVRDLSVQNDSLRAKLEQVTVENNNQVRQIHSEWDIKHRRQEDLNREKDRVIAEMEAELRSMTDHISKIKIEFEDELRRQINIAREEEKNRFTLMIKEVEAKLRDVTSERESLARRVQDLIRDCQQRERQLQEVKIQLDGEIARKKNEVLEMKRNLELATGANEKIRNELTHKDAHIGRLESEIANLKREMDRLKEMHVQEMNRIINNHASESRRWEDVERNLKLKLVEIEKVLRTTEDELTKCKKEYDRLRDAISGNINRTIDQTFVDYKGFNETRPSTQFKPSLTTTSLANPGPSRGTALENTQTQSWTYQGGDYGQTQPQSKPVVKSSYPEETKTTNYGASTNTYGGSAGYGGTNYGDQGYGGSNYGGQNYGGQSGYNNNGGDLGAIGSTSYGGQNYFESTHTYGASANNYGGSNFGGTGTNYGGDQGYGGGSGFGASDPYGQNKSVRWADNNEGENQYSSRYGQPGNVPKTVDYF